MVLEAKGKSAYFSAPEQTLDPALFSGMMLEEEIRAWIVSHLITFWEWEGVTVSNWLYAWLAGSGVSYQWAADRGNGDLDVLLGVDYDLFTAQNPELKTGSRPALAAVVNDHLRTYLWPLTAAAELGGKKYEVTYYWNADVSNDIRVAKPYAAWNLGDSTWDVLPPDNPAPSAYPVPWFDQAKTDTARVLQVYTEYSNCLSDATRLPASNHRFAAAMRGLDRTTAELRLMWDTLHEGRRSAFSDGGEGYGDWHNFRWQAAKASGITDILRGVIKEADQRKIAAETRLFGAPIQPAELALRSAANQYTAWAR